MTARFGWLLFCQGYWKHPATIGFSFKRFLCETLTGSNQYKGFFRDDRSDFRKITRRRQRVWPGHKSNVMCPAAQLAPP